MTTCLLLLMYRDKIPVLKRFSGGGTVIVDHNTVFTTFICNQRDFPTIKPFPRDIMAWSHDFFAPFFSRIGRKDLVRSVSRQLYNSC